MHEKKNSFFGLWSKTHMFALGLLTTKQVVWLPLADPFEAASDTSIAALARATEDVGEHCMRSISCCGLVAIANCRQLPSIRRRCRAPVGFLLFFVFFKPMYGFGCVRQHTNKAQNRWRNEEGG